jgi:hypothetical protein
MSSMVAKRVPVRPIIIAWNGQKSLGASFREYSAWVIYFSQQGIAAKQGTCGSVRYCDAEAAFPVTRRAASSKMHSIPFQHATSAKLSCRNNQQHSAQMA